MHDIHNVLRYKYYINAYYNDKIQYGIGLYMNTLKNIFFIEKLYRYYIGIQ